jgi:hypothetical protein
LRLQVPTRAVRDSSLIATRLTSAPTRSHQPTTGAVRPKSPTPRRLRSWYRNAASCSSTCPSRVSRRWSASVTSGSTGRIPVSAIGSARAASHACMKLSARSYRPERALGAENAGRVLQRTVEKPGCPSPRPFRRSEVERAIPTPSVPDPDRRSASPRARSHALGRQHSDDYLAGRSFALVVAGVGAVTGAPRRRSLPPSETRCSIPNAARRGTATHEGRPRDAATGVFTRRRELRRGTRWAERRRPQLAGANSSPVNTSTFTPASSRNFVGRMPPANTST